MSEPLFTDTTQIGIVVRDLDATIRNYEALGIGPWTFYEVDPSQATDLHEHGREKISATRCATTKVGGVWWEVFEPLDDDGIFAQFLKEKGEGVHHIAVKAPDYDGALARQTEPLPLTGSFMGVQVSYLPTHKTLGVLLEVFTGFPEDEP